MAVEFISYGYDTAPGEGLGELVWQDMFPSIGSAGYGVRSPLDWKVSAVSGADRTVSITAGRGFGLGVIDKTVANDTIQLDPINSGSRWDLIACRRDPTPTKGKSEFVKINGGSTPVIPGGRLSGPGIHDQPLALVQVTAGQTQPTAFIDLRTWVGDGGGLVAASDLVRSYLNQTGTRINIAGTDWVRRVGENDTPEWAKLTESGKIPLFGVQPNRIGGTPPAGTQFLMQAGSTVIPREVNGYGTIWLPKVFPNGVISATVSNGDIRATERGWHAGLNDVNTTALFVNLSNGNGVGYSRGIWRCDWMVIGW